MVGEFSHATDRQPSDVKCPLRLSRALNRHGAPVRDFVVERGAKRSVPLPTSDVTTALGPT